MNIKQCADNSFAMTLLKYKSVYVVFLVIKIVGYTKMLQQMYDYWIFIRLIVTEISG